MNVLLFPEYLRSASNKGRNVVDNLADVKGNASRRIRRMGPSLENANFQIRPLSPHH
jgi:hypothetical protein